MTSGRDDHAGVRIPPPIPFLAAILLGFGLEALWPAPLPEAGLALARPVAIGLGAALVLAGLGLAIAAMQRFRAAGTEVKPWKPSTALVGLGPYRRTRNPMYLGMLLVLLGTGLVAGSLWHVALLVPLWAFLRYAVIAREERYLEARFGEDYRRYRRAVRRWL